MPVSFSQFKKTIWSYYHEHRRNMPWRENITPYNVVVSEIMLQQTQVDRVTQKFISFLRTFPDWQQLAQATTTSVLTEWRGLGYNRRALYLKRIAEHITEGGETKGMLPSSIEELEELPGIGPNTAGSIMAFAYNKPSVFIETNIRSVFIHFFFPHNSSSITDKEILKLVEHTIDKKNPREWYYALMDYGAYLKTTIPNPSRKSKHYVKPVSFKGSNREMRGKILRFILHQSTTLKKISKEFQAYPQTQLMRNLTNLEKEGFIKRDKGKYSVG